MLPVKLNFNGVLLLCLLCTGGPPLRLPPVSSSFHLLWRFNNDFTREIICYVCSFLRRFHASRRVAVISSDGLCIENVCVLLWGNFSEFRQKEA